VSLPQWDKDDIDRLNKVVTSDVPGLMGEVGGVTSVSVSCRDLDPSPHPSLLGRLFCRSKRNQLKPKGKTVVKRKGSWNWWWVASLLVVVLAYYGCGEHIGIASMLAAGEHIGNASMLAALFLDACEPSRCSLGHVFKTAPPRHCSGMHCEESECCEPAGTCKLSLCGSGQMLKDPPPFHCSSTACTQEECCEVEQLIAGSAGWWSCKHDGMHPCVPGPGCCCNPGTSFDASMKRCSAWH